MKKNIFLLFAVSFCFNFTSCLFDWADYPASVVFTDDKTIECRWNPIKKESCELKAVKIDGLGKAYYLESYGGVMTIELLNDVEEGKEVTLVFDRSDDRTLYYIFIKDKVNDYPKVKCYTEAN